MKYISCSPDKIKAADKSLGEMEANIYSVVRSRNSLESKYEKHKAHLQTMKDPISLYDLQEVKKAEEDLQEMKYHLSVLTNLTNWIDSNSCLSIKELMLLSDY